jgi:hypothetical protein
MLSEAVLATLYFDPDATFKAPFLINCVEPHTRDERLGARRVVLDQPLERYRVDDALYRLLADAASVDHWHNKAIQDLDISAPLHPTLQLPRPTRLSNSHLGAFYRHVPAALAR